LKEYIDLKGRYYFLLSKYWGLTLVAFISPAMLYKIYISGTFGLYASWTVLLAIVIAIETKYTTGHSKY
jgi:hypothetical protein